ncbi:MAG TPA: hypothetical protein VNB29_05925 [Chthoniobacterales bacterium]|nr:hypothetical protein [Chthoniobacterales bacterium]
MNSDSKIFAEFLRRELPADTSYLDVVYACRRIFCTLDGLPPEIAGLELDKETIASGFADWTKRNQSDDFGQLYSSAYSAAWHRPGDEGHWLQVISSVLTSAALLDFSPPLPFSYVTATPGAAAPSRHVP